ncbi:tRNA glutamyl-Q(34) synthetase GluQRS [Candidatus Sororendozoicomonas aggregata]|uniref:tRNA glutamyl-Q(34) synthetase GluQRS n=1 Tax=Candidatus Sororendozoicomonas aggregata TaxID=3073239 RepID=UPI002ED0C748
MDVTPPYTGRFAPSPSGPLHFGSLVTALASYLDARAHQGQWLVRIEDIDPPREQPGSALLILKALENYGMIWDGEVLYQSLRTGAYQHELERLLKQGLLYPCTCTRKRLAGLAGVYPGYCRSKTSMPQGPYSLRLQCPDQPVVFEDRIQGRQEQQLSALGDFILRRKDNLYAYQLAVCVDDAFQKISHVVRGYDLMDSTSKQLYLQSVLGYRQPAYAHVPVITANNTGEKLSKQNHAAPLPLDEPRPLLIKAMNVIGVDLDISLNHCSVEEIIHWGVKHWRINNIIQSSSIPLPPLS